MVVSVEHVAREFLDIEAGVPIPVDIPAFLSSDIYVYYGIAALLAEEGVDYEVVLGGDFQTFTITPLQPLLDKINLLIRDDADEVNGITVRRTLDYTTEATAPGVRNTQFTSREFDRVAMRDQQLADLASRAVRLGDRFIGGQLTIDQTGPNRVLVFDADGTGVVAGPTESEISNAESFAQRAEAAAANLEAYAAVIVTNKYAPGELTNPLILSYAPASKTNCLIFIDGVKQDLDQFSLSGNELTFTGGWPDGLDTVEVTLISATEFVLDAEVLQQLGTEVGDLRLSVQQLDTEVDTVRSDIGANAASISALTTDVRLNTDNLASVLNSLQTDALDARDGAILRMDGVVGSFGLGAIRTPFLTDIDAVDIPAGFYRAIGPSTTGTFPVGASQFGGAIVFRYDGTDFAQFYYGVSSDRVWFRRHREAAGGHGPWVPLHNPIPRTETKSPPGNSFLLQNVPASFEHVEVRYDGIPQNPDEYTLTDQTVIFTGGEPVGVDTVTVRYWYF